MKEKPEFVKLVEKMFNLIKDKKLKEYIRMEDRFAEVGTDKKDKVIVKVSREQK